MATACAASLAMLDAGVPIAAPVAGVSVGLVSETDPSSGDITRYQLLTDILGLEDHYGDMDFKVAGTRDGITAVQLDVKLAGGVPLEILCEGLDSAMAGRLHILDAMDSVRASPRKDLKPHTPRVAVVAFDPDRLKDLILSEIAEFHPTAEM